MKDLIASLKVGLLLLLLDALTRGGLAGLCSNDPDFVAAFTIYITFMMLLYWGWVYVLIVFLFIKIISRFPPTLPTYLFAGAFYLLALFAGTYFLLGGPSDLMGDNMPIVTWVFYPISGLILGYLIFRYKTKTSNA